MPVFGVLVYGSKTWAMKAEDLARLGRAERMMVRRMCGVSITLLRPFGQIRPMKIHL